MASAASKKASRVTPSKINEAWPQEVQPTPGSSYPELLRTPTYAWWRSLLGVLLGVSLFLVMTTVISQAVVVLAWTITGRGVAYPEYIAEAVAFQRASGMLATNLGIACLIPISWMLMALVHRVRPRWLTSVQPKMRWRYFVVCLGVAAIALNGVLALSTVVADTPNFEPQAGLWRFLLVIVVTSPLQAAAEEIFFRGYLMQALGSLVAQPWFGVVVSAVVFALFHGTQNPALFVDRLAFGLLAAVLVWRTGGLEASIAAHVVNNVFAYGIAGFTTSIATLKALQSLTWLDAVFDVGGFMVFAGLALLVAHRMRLQTRVASRTGVVA